MSTRFENQTAIIRAVVGQRHGGADVLELQWATVPPPAAGEVLVRHRMIGVNFVDVYHRRGDRPLPVPFVLGLEAAGVIEATGPHVTDFRPGDRVAYARARGPMPRQQSSRQRA